MLNQDTQRKLHIDFCRAVAIGLELDLTDDHFSVAQVWEKTGPNERHKMPHSFIEFCYKSCGKMQQRMIQEFGIPVNVYSSDKSLSRERLHISILIELLAEIRLVFKVEMAIMEVLVAQQTAVQRQPIADPLIAHQAPSNAVVHNNAEGVERHAISVAPELNENFDGYNVVIDDRAVGYFGNYECR
jgi:hypothetical protein